MQARVVLFVCAGLIAGLASVREARADAATEQARRHYLKGNQFFDVGRWDEAAEEYERAYEIRSDPSLLYNMAQAFRRKGDAKRALDLYKNYLIKAPRNPQRAEVEERIRALQKQIDEADGAAKGPSVTSSPTSAGSAPELGSTPSQSAPVPVTVPPVPSAPPSPDYAPAQGGTTLPEGGVAPRTPAPFFYPTPAGTPPPAGSPTAVAAPAASAGGSWAPSTPPPYVQAPGEPAVAKPGLGLRVSGVAFGVAGVTLVGAGIVFGVLTKSYSDSVQSGAVFNPNFEERGKLYETLQWVGYGAGAGLIATGAILYGVGVSTGAKAQVTIAPTAGPGHAGVSAGGIF